MKKIRKLEGQFCIFAKVKTKSHSHVNIISIQEYNITLFRIVMWYIL